MKAAGEAQRNDKVEQAVGENLLKEEANEAALEDIESHEEKNLLSAQKKVKIDEQTVILGETGSIGEYHDESILAIADNDDHGNGPIFGNVHAPIAASSYISGNFGSRKSKDKNGYESKVSKAKISSDKVDGQELENSSRGLLHSEAYIQNQDESAID